MRILRISDRWWIQTFSITKHPLMNLPPHFVLIFPSSIPPRSYLALLLFSFCISHPPLPFSVLCLLYFFAFLLCFCFSSDFHYPSLSVTCCSLNLFSPLSSLPNRLLPRAQSTWWVIVSSPAHTPRRGAYLCVRSCDTHIHQCIQTLTLFIAPSLSCQQICLPSHLQSSPPICQPSFR